MGLDFIAGLITGEGCFCLGARRVAARKGKLRITPVFDLFMTDRETITEVARALEEYNLPVYVQERPKATGSGQVGIHAGGMLRVKRYAETFLPLLTGTKRRAAELTLVFINSRLSKPKGSPYSEPELAIVEELRRVNGNRNGKKTPLESSETVRREPVASGL